ncbi:MAG TPA: DHHA1 domain-containing protein, partial [Bacteroidales bacterium]|nr:DHHA1 domain-containing protein [Bacteroidales bacterium]
DIKQDIPMSKALEIGALALFGEKYGEKVRVVTFDPNLSVELCGGTHVDSTGNIGFFKIISESGIAAGVRRIEAVAGEKSEEYVYGQVNKLNSIKDLFKNQPHTLLAVKNIIAEHHSLQKEIDNLKNQQALEISNTLLNNAKVISDIRFISEKTKLDINQAKNLAQKLRLSGENIVAVLSTHNNEKVNLIVSISDKLILTKGYNAGNIIKEISPYIKGGGGGQPFLATAGGKDASGIDAAFQAAKEIVTK